MIDFTKNPFDKSNSKELKKFIKKKYISKEDFDSKVDLDEEDIGEDVLSVDSFIDGQPIDLGQGIGSDDDMMSYDDIFDYSGNGSSGDSKNISEDISWQKDNVFLSWITAPYYLFHFVITMVAYRYKDFTRENQISVLRSLNGITMFSAITSLLLWLVDFKFIFNLGFQSITSLLMFILSMLALKFIYKEEIHLPILGTLGSPKEEEPKELLGDLDDLDGLMELGTVDDSALGYGGTLVLEEENYEIDYDDDSNDYEIEDESHDFSKGLPHSPIDTSNLNSFKETILDVYKKNQKYQGVEFANRIDLMQSLSGYIISNDRRFGSWETIRLNSKEAHNIAFAIYLALTRINKSFSTNEDMMIVSSMKKNPLLIKVDFRLPEYYNISTLKSRIVEFENAVKRNESDTKVSVQISDTQGLFTIKFLNLENSNLISMGDILRFVDTDDEDDSAFEKFSNPKIGMPMLIGLKGNEYPTVIDFEDNTSATIVGGSGSGKSWLTFSLMFNFVLANDYNNTQFLILDKKNAPFWNQFAKFPHVLGYHTDTETYLDIFREIYDEITRRKALLNELGAENIKGLRKMYRENGETEKLKEVPLFTVVVDEITSTMSRLKSDYENRDEIYKFNELKTIMGNITEEGRSLGVRLIVIGQRSIDASIPKSVMLNSSLKFGMRMEVDSEFEIMFGKTVNKMSKPGEPGMGILRSFAENGLYSIKTLTVGGKDDMQILTLIRVLALEWVRRSIGKDDILNPPKGLKLPLSYNRHKFTETSLKEIREGYILDANIQSPQVALNPESIQNGQVFDSSVGAKNVFLEKEESNFEDYSVDDIVYSDDEFIEDEDFLLPEPSSLEGFDGDIDDDDESAYSLKNEDFSTISLNEDIDDEESTYNLKTDNFSTMSTKLEKESESFEDTDLEIALDNLGLFGEDIEDSVEETKTVEDIPVDILKSDMFSVVEDAEVSVTDVPKNIPTFNQDILNESSDSEDMDIGIDFDSIFDNVLNDTNEKPSIFETASEKSIENVDSEEISDTLENLEEIPDILGEELGINNFNISSELEEDLEENYIKSEDNLYTPSTHMHDKLEQEAYAKNQEILGTLNDSLVDGLMSEGEDLLIEADSSLQEAENINLFGDFTIQDLFNELDEDEDEEDSLEDIQMVVESMNILKSETPPKESKRTTLISNAFEENSDFDDEFTNSISSLLNDLLSNTEKKLNSEKASNSTNVNPNLQSTIDKQKQSFAETQKLEELRKEKLRRKQQADANLKNETNKPRTSKGSIKFKYTSTVDTSKEPKIGVKEYIIKNGEKFSGLVNYRITTSELESVYSMAKIQKALDNLLIIKDGDYYKTKVV